MADGGWPTMRKPMPKPAIVRPVIRTYPLAQQSTSRTQPNETNPNSNGNESSELSISEVGRSTNEERPSYIDEELPSYSYEEHPRYSDDELHDYIYEELLRNMKNVPRDDPDILTSEEIMTAGLEEAREEQDYCMTRWANLPKQRFVTLTEVSAVMYTVQIHLNLNLWGQINWPLMKHCRPVQDVEIVQYFERHKVTLMMIASGQIFNKRHTAFFTGAHSREILNARCIIQLFRPQQIELMFQKMIQTFGSLGEGFKYFSDVLLPEFCLLVFMEDHHKNREEAERYLKESS